MKIFIVKQIDNTGTHVWYTQSKSAAIQAAEELSREFFHSVTIFEQDLSDLLGALNAENESRFASERHVADFAVETA